MRKGRRLRSIAFIAFTDTLTLVLTIIIMMVAAKRPENPSGIKVPAQFLVTAEWSTKRDADADLWLVPPDRRPIYYSSRENACISLDRDSRGFLDNVTFLPDGRRIESMSSKETATIRCIVPGRYNVGVHLYRYNSNDVNEDKNALAIKVHIEVIKVNPSYQTVFTDEVTLNRVWDSVNSASFDLDAEGHITFVDAPLEPITNSFYRGRSGP